MLDDVVECGKEVFAALVEEVGGIGVAVEGGAGGEFEVGDDAIGGFPVEEGGFDFGAVGVVADGAFAGVEVVLDAGGWRVDAGFGGALFARLGGWWLLRRGFGGGELALGARLDC